MGGALFVKTPQKKNNRFAPHDNNAHKKSEAEAGITALAVPDCRAHYRRCAQSHYTAVQSQSLQNTAARPRIAASARGAARYTEP